MSGLHSGQQKKHGNDEKRDGKKTLHAASQSLTGVAGISQNTKNSRKK